MFLHVYCKYSRLPSFIIFQWAIYEWNGLWFKFLKDIESKNNGPQWELGHLTFIYSEKLSKLIKGTEDQLDGKLNQNGHIKKYIFEA